MEHMNSSVSLARGENKQVLKKGPNYHTANKIGIFRIKIPLVKAAHIIFFRVRDFQLPFTYYI